MFLYLVYKYSGPLELKHNILVIKVSKLTQI